jgi:hypothetical protein
MNAFETEVVTVVVELIWRMLVTVRRQTGSARLLAVPEPPIGNRRDWKNLVRGAHDSKVET